MIKNYTKLAASIALMWVLPLIISRLEAVEKKRKK